MSLLDGIISAVAPAIAGTIAANKAASAGKKAAASAAAATTSAAKTSADTLMSMYREGQAKQEPFRQAGLAALPKQMYYAGVSMPKGGISLGGIGGESSSDKLKSLYAEYRKEAGLEAAAEAAGVDKQQLVTAIQSGDNETATSLINEIASQKDVDLSAFGWGDPPTTYGGAPLTQGTSLNIGKSLATALGVAIGVPTLGESLYPNQSYTGAPVYDATGGGSEATASEREADQLEADYKAYMANTAATLNTTGGDSAAFGGGPTGQGQGAHSYGTDDTSWADDDSSNNDDDGGGWSSGGGTDHGGPGW